MRHLRHFVALAETLNFHRAAERLHIAQPPLTASIRKLEADLGVQLFDRNRRGTELTDAGAAALQHARLALFHAEQFRKVAKAAGIGEAGTLKVGFVGSATYALMPKVMPLFRERYPAIELHLAESTTKRILGQVESGDLDVGLLRFPVSQVTTVRIAPVERDVFVAALPATHRLAKKRVINLSDLAEDPFVFYSAQDVPGLHMVAVLACQQAGFVPKVQQAAVQVQTVVSLVESGLGVALVPSVAMRHSTRSVVFKTLRGAGSDLEIGIALAWQPAIETSVAKRFRETLEEVAGESRFIA
jgi:DNA-binding transcriptional LysR family regulator